MIHTIVTLGYLQLLLATQPALAQESGVLLGIHLSSASSASEYRTLWIAPVSGTPRLVAEGPDLLVPRKTGFWRVCLVAKHDTTDGQLRESDTLIAGPATRDRGRCNTVVDSVTDAMRQAVHCSGSELSTILFVGGDYVSVLRPSLAAIKSAVPRVRDAVSSPRGEMLVALTDDSLFVLPVNGGKLGKPIASVEVSGTIVMAQWAVGSSVPIWTRQLTALMW